MSTTTDDELAEFFRSLSLGPNYDSCGENLKRNGATKTTLQQLASTGGKSSVISFLEDCDVSNTIQRHILATGIINSVMTKKESEKLDVAKDEFYGELMRINALSSLLSGKQEKGFDVFLLPPGHGAYIPNSRLRSLSLAPQEYSNHPSMPIIVDKLNKMITSAPRVFRATTQSETRVCRPILESFLDLIAQDNEHISRVTGSCFTSLYSGNYGGYQLAKPESRPEPLLLVQRKPSCYRLPVLVSEAKGIDDSAFVGLPQGCQVAGDSALLLQHIGLPEEHCTVPGVLVFGDCLQFYGSFLLDRFPCFALLSKPLSFVSRSDLEAIAAWIIALRVWAESFLDIATENTLTDKPLPAAVDMSSKFLKPIRLRGERERKARTTDPDVYPERMAMTRVLEIFATLSNDAEASKYVTFPIGWIRLPSETEQPQLWSAIQSRLAHQIAKYGLTWPEMEELQGFLVFHEHGERWNNAQHVDEEHAAGFEKTFAAAVAATTSAGVVHLDLRPANVLWHCRTCVSASAADPAEEHIVEVKLIDWEDARLVGEAISDVEEYSKDLRYPLAHVEGINLEAGLIAQPCLDIWACKQVCEFAKSSHDDFGAFMAQGTPVSNALLADIAAQQSSS